MTTESNTRIRRWLGFWSVGLLAFIGIFVMTESPSEWFWFAPLLIPFLVLLPSRTREWDIQDKEKKCLKEERRLNGEVNLVRKVLKWIFWLILIGLIWYVGSYFLWVAILG